MLGNLWNTLFYEPIMNAMLFLYSITGNNLGVAIILLTLILRFALFPFLKKQFDSSQKLKEIQPELEKLRKKYSANPQKIQEEQIKLYRKVGYNPLGCFASTIIPLPIMVAIYQSIRAFSGGEVTGIYTFVSNLINGSGDININTQFLLWDLSESYMPLAKEHGYFALWLLPYLGLAILAGISQYASVKINSMQSKSDKEKEKEKKDKEKAKKSKKKKDDPQENMGQMMTEMNKSMSFTFPVMTAVIALSLPAALSLYFSVQSWVTILLRFVYLKLTERKNG